jgi:hypothetical protein
LANRPDATRVFVEITKVIQGQSKEDLALRAKFGTRYLKIHGQKVVGVGSWLAG